MFLVILLVYLPIGIICLPCTYHASSSKPSTITLNQKNENKEEPTAATTNIHARLEAEAKKYPNDMGYQAGINAAKSILLPKIVDVEKDLKINNEQVSYFMELLGLSMVRNRIIDVETRFGVGAMEPDELLNYLNQSKSDLKNITAVFYESLEEWRNVVNANGLQKVHHKLTKGEQVKVNELQSFLERVKDEQMLDNVPIKAAKHFMRCKSIFYLYPARNEVKKMREFIDQKFQGDIEEACREVGYIVVKTSTIGVHILPPGFPRRVTPEMIKHGFKRFQMADENTLNAVDLLYCNQVKSAGA